MEHSMHDVDAAEETLHSFFIRQGKNEFTHSFGNIRDHDPHFRIELMYPAFEQAAVRLKMRVALDKTGDTSMKITLIERLLPELPGGRNRLLNA